MKKLFPVVLFLISVFSVQAQDLIPFRNGDKWGFSDTVGNIVIDTMYQSVSFFHNGSASVKSNDRFFLLNTKGERITDMTFDGISEFSEGFYAIQKDSLFGIINAKGKIIVAPKYKAMSLFSNGLAGFQSAENMKIGFIDYKGKIKIKPAFGQVDDFTKAGLALVRKDSLYQVINKKGKTIFIPPAYAPVKVSDAGYIVATRLDESNNIRQNFADYIAIFNTKGEMVYDLEADTLTLADYPNGNKIIVRTLNSTYRYVDIITRHRSPVYTSARPFNEGKAIVITDGKMYIISENYDTLCSINNNAITDAGIVSEGYIGAKSADYYFGATYGYITTDCTIGVAFVFDQVGPFKNGYAIVKFGDQYGIINKQGRKYWFN